MNIHRVGTEEIIEGVLVTRIARKPPRYRLEQFLEDGQVKAAMLIKAPKGTKGYHVVLDGKGTGYSCPTKRKAIIAFAELQAAFIKEEPVHIPHVYDAPHRAPFSHNDVDEDGAIIDIDTDGNEMEYGK